MRKISIVGVEGSGKTVLLSALGDKYENPDGSGIFMSPENARAFGFVKLHMEAMRNGHWPAATTTNSNLDWTIYQKNSTQKQIISQLSLLDFAGELYRLCFGEHTEEEASVWADEISVLKDHIAESDLLMVIVNLSDIINASPADPRARETMWLSKSVIDYATRNGRNKEVSIVFSQADIYENEINACGGNNGVLQKYLPHVANLYDNLPVFAISAINKTVPDENGMPVPAKDFESEGLDDLMEWIVAKTPGFEELAQTMNNNRFAPIRLWNEAKELYEKYTNSPNAGTFERFAIAERLTAVLNDLNNANVKFPKNAPDSSEQSELEVKAQEIFSFETMANDVINSVTYRSYKKALHKLEQYSAQSANIADCKDLLAEEAKNYYNSLSRKHAAMVRKRIFKTCAIIILLGISGFAAGFAADFGVKYYKQKQAALQHEREMAQKEQEGYDIVFKDGKKTAVWTPGKPHPKCQYLIADKKEKVWTATLPGYVWDGNIDVKWQEGLQHPDNKYLTSGKDRETWLTDRPGYVWKNGKDIEWQEGFTSEKYPHWIASATKDEWRIQEGYTLKDKNAKPLSELIWDVGFISADGRRKASSTEGIWLTKHTCTNCSASGKIKSNVSCWNCSGRGKVESRENCSYCNGNGKITTTTDCYQCGGDGLVSENCVCGVVGDQYGNIGTYHGYVCNVCNGLKYLFGVACYRCNGYGYLTCSDCGETGYKNVTCSNCSSGKIYSQKTCSHCSWGKVDVRRDCPYCSYGKIPSTENCSDCNGKGYNWK